MMTPEGFNRMLAEFNDPDSSTRKRYKAAMERLERDTRWRELQQAIERSERITSEDLNITVF